MKIVKRTEERNLRLSHYSSVRGKNRKRARKMAPMADCVGTD